MTVIPKQALDLIKRWEGIRRAPYICSGNKLTVGYGHLVKKNRQYDPFTGQHIHNVTKALRRFSGSRRVLSRSLEIIFPDLITEEQAEALLIKDAERLYGQALRLVHVKLYEPQKAAICSFVYNLGVTNFSKSTLLRKLNAGDIHGAAHEFDRWVYAGKTRLRGLERRRAEEKELFLKNIK